MIKTTWSAPCHYRHPCLLQMKPTPQRGLTSQTLSHHEGPEDTVERAGISPVPVPTTHPDPIDPEGPEYYDDDNDDADWEESPAMEADVEDTDDDKEDEEEHA